MINNWGLYTSKCRFSVFLSFHPTKRCSSKLDTWGGGAHFHVVVLRTFIFLKSIVFMICEHEYDPYQPLPQILQLATTMENKQSHRYYHTLWCHKLCWLYEVECLHKKNIHCMWFWVIFVQNVICGQNFVRCRHLLKTWYKQCKCNMLTACRYTEKKCVRFLFYLSHPIPPPHNYQQIPQEYEWNMSTNNW